MRVLFYSAKKFEIPYLDKSNHLHLEVGYTDKPLKLETAQLAKGYDCISVFVNDDVSNHVLAELKLFGVKFIAVRAAGYDNVDVHEAETLGIRVANVPAYSPYAVAEHAIALILTLARQITIADKQVHRYDFSLEQLVGFNLHGKTVGIIGTGSIGSITARILRGFGCEVIAYDIVQSEQLQKEHNVSYCTLNELCLKSDIISIHTPLNRFTHHLLNRGLFSIMKKGVMIVNTARGGVVNTSDLIEFIHKGVIGSYGGDVYEKERDVFLFDHSLHGISDPILTELLSMKNVLITPHQAFATYEALSEIADTTFYNITEWNAGGRPENELTHKLSLIAH